MRRFSAIATMFHIVLFEPEIPPNTGNVIRLCANLGAALHLIRPLGFELDHAKLRRAGLDYHEFTRVRPHDDFRSFIETAKPARVFALSTRGSTRYTDVSVGLNDAFVFGPETRGLSQEFLEALPEANRLSLPMAPGGRSLNLSNAVAIVGYEAWRQLGFVGSR
jgi:tRNA (cytidine/uridine-2'-O-)-methyltransferase